MEKLCQDVLSTRCTINLNAVRYNIELLRDFLPPQTRLMPILKADAYGTNALQMATFLQSCDVDIVGVAHVDEGITLKENVPNLEVFCLHAAPYEAERAVAHSLQLGVGSSATLKAISNAAKQTNKQAAVHLHADTGMSRLGCRPEEALALATAAESDPHLALEGVMTHFAAADNSEHDPFTLNQAHAFSDIIKQLEQHGISPPWRHAANTSAVMRFCFRGFNMVRVGLALYGLVRHAEPPIADQLKLALTLTTKITAINVCMQGETVSYGRRWSAKQDFTRIAILPIGYHDGLHRHYSNRGHVLIRGKRLPIVGTVCMDYCMVDITTLPEAEVGDDVTLFGEDAYGNLLHPKEVAHSGETIVHELIACLGPRIQRIFVS